MKKIGIITFHASHNCGSMLQAHALQRIIKEQTDLSSEIINFSNKEQQRLYNIFISIRKPWDILTNFARLIFLPLLNKQRTFYEQFMANYFILSPQFHETSEDLKQIDGKYDYIICGSDQVWNTKCGDADDAYYLNFITQGKKISYATSLGATNIGKDPKDRVYYKNILSSFNSISVREKNAQRIISDITGRNDIKLLFDPTLLLLREDWEKYVKEPLYNEKYIFYYAFAYLDDINETVKAISKKYNMPVIIMDARAWSTGRKFKDGFKLSKEFGPLAFLNLVKNASLVLTTSFHGTVFSVIFEKHFWFIDSSRHNRDDDRAESLLTQLTLLDRLKHKDLLVKEEVFENIDYKKIKENIEIVRQLSLDYIKESLDE